MRGVGSHHVRHDQKYESRDLWQQKVTDKKRTSPLHWCGARCTFRRGSRLFFKGLRSALHMRGGKKKFRHSPTCATGIHREQRIRRERNRRRSNLILPFAAETRSQHNGSFTVLYNSINHCYRYASLVRSSVSTMKLLR